MKLKNYPVCAPDECFSSWAYRASMNRNLPGRLYVDRIVQCFGDEDDYDFSVSGLSRVAFKYSFEVNRLIWYFRPHCLWLLPYEKRQVYCFECLKSDISNGSLPWWRKSWCYLYCPICPLHRTVLRRMAQLDTDLGKAWWAFSKTAEWDRFDDNSRNIEWPLVYKSLGSDVIGLALKTQNIIALAHNNKTIAIRGGAQLDSVDILSLCALVFNHVVYPRRPGVYYGIGRFREYRLPLSRFPDHRSAVKAGCEDCDVFPRIIALLLIGLILGAYPSECIGKLDIGLPIYLRDGNLGSIGRCFAHSVSSDFRTLARHQLYDGSEAFLLHIQAFLDGISAHTSGFSYEAIMKDRIIKGM